MRFDGVNFTTFSKGNTKGILNNRFTGIYCDKDGTLYATTMEDGILTIYRDGGFSTYNSEQVPGHYIQTIKPDENGELRFLVEDEERNSKSWYYLRDGKFVFSEKLTQNAEEKIVVQGKSGAKWIITPNETVELRDGKTIVYPLSIGQIASRVTVFEDRESSLWIGENSVHQLRNGVIKTFTEKDGFPRNSLYHSFWEDSDGKISVGLRAAANRVFQSVWWQYQNGKMFFLETKRRLPTLRLPVSLATAKTRSGWRRTRV